MTISGIFQSTSEQCYKRQLCNFSIATCNDLVHCWSTVSCCCFHLSAKNSYDFLQFECYVIHQNNNSHINFQYLGSIIVNKWLIRSISNGQALLSAFWHDFIRKYRLNIMAMHSLHKFVELAFSIPEPL